MDVVKIITLFHIWICLKRTCAPPPICNLQEGSGWWWLFANCRPPSPISEHYWLWIQIEIQIQIGELACGGPSHIIRVLYFNIGFATCYLSAPSCHSQDWGRFKMNKERFVIMILALHLRVPLKTLEGPRHGKSSRYMNSCCANFSRCAIAYHIEGHCILVPHLSIVNLTINCTYHIIEPCELGLSCFRAWYT